MTARIMIGLLVALGIASSVLGYWGVETVAGRQAFDEMAGMIPFAAQVLGGVMLAAAVVVSIFCFCRRTPGPGR